jgi:chlorite dismutase
VGVARRDEQHAVRHDARKGGARREASRKTTAWWDLPQDERRRILEESSKHISIGLKYLPAIARRLHHCRDLGSQEPFDFLTWFDYAPEHAQAFEDLAGELRATEEWKFVDREVDIRLAR